MCSFPAGMLVTTRSQRERKKRFKMSHGEAYQAYQKMKALRNEPVEEQEWLPIHSFVRLFSRPAVKMAFSEA
jgi:hypothetical protein